MRQSDKLRGSALLICATIIWGNAFIAQSVGMDSMGPFTFQTVRCALAILFLFPASTLFKARACGLKKALVSWRNPTLWKAGIICGFALFCAASLQQAGLVYTDAGKAGFITAMYIVLVPILGLFLGKKPSKAEIISVLIAVVGLYLLSCAGASGINFGDVLLMGCALGFSIQILLIERLAGELDGMQLNCVQAIVITVLSVPFMMATEQPQIKNILDCWLPLCFAGILSMGAAYSLQIEGQKLLEPTAASLLMSTESVFAALGGWLILHEHMTAAELCGCVLVFSAIILSQLPRRKQC